MSAAESYLFLFRLANYLAAKDPDEKADFSFDGGLKVPHKLWQALYKYQKTGKSLLQMRSCYTIEVGKSR